MQNRLTRSSIVLLALVLGCAGTVSDNDVTLQPRHPDPNQALVVQCADGDPPPAPPGLRIREIALYQTVKSRLYANDRWQAPTSLGAPLIAGKRGLLRVFVERENPDDPSAFEPQRVRALVTVRNGYESTTRAEVKLIEGDSSEDERASTLEVELEGHLLGSASALSVALQQEECEPRPGERSEKARLPPSGEQALSMQVVGKLRVKVIPIQVKGGSLPDVSDKELKKIREALLAYYPVPDVEVTARREKLVFPKALPASNSGQEWNELLRVLDQLRKKDGADSDLYYYGMFRPTQTMEQYCRGTTCTLGMSWQATLNNASNFSGVGISFVSPKQTVYETAVHEIAHLHGLGHAPCAVSEGVDASFPDVEGLTRTEGWDARSDELMRGDRSDVMGYCERPRWISEYHYKMLANRAATVNRLSALVRGEGSYRPLFITDEGRARWGIGDPELPSGRSAPTLVRDASGTTIAEVEGVWRPVSHGAPVLYLPPLDDAWATLTLDDGRTVERATMELP